MEHLIIASTDAGSAVEITACVAAAVGACVSESCASADDHLFYKSTRCTRPSAGRRSLSTSPRMLSEPDSAFVSSFRRPTWPDRSLNSHVVSIHLNFAIIVLSQLTFDDIWDNRNAIYHKRASSGVACFISGLSLRVGSGTTPITRRRDGTIWVHAPR